MRAGRTAKLARDVEKDEVRVIARNRKASFLYEIIDKMEAGIALLGSEVKSLRSGKVTLTEAYAAPHGQELFLHNLHIPPYSQATIETHDPLRRRKLLMHRRQIRRLLGKVQERGLTLVPLQIYFRGGHAKIELALVRGKHKFDKREAIAKRDARRDLDRARSKERE
jgi:SsrA-binding protein